MYEKHFGWKIRDDELRKSQERAIHRSKGFTGLPPPQSASHQASQSTAPASTPASRPSTADKVKKQVSFGGTDTTFFHPSAPTPEVSNLSLSSHAPHKEPSSRPFEPKMASWDPARTAPPQDSEPEAKNLSISAYESVWDKPFDPNEPKWVPPPRGPLPKGLDYNPPAPESHDFLSDSEDEEHDIVESRSSSESPETLPPETVRYAAVFPWETSPKRQTATRVFPDDEPAKAKEKAIEARSYDRRASLEKYEFTNAYAHFIIRLTSSWDSLPIIQSYVKQKLGEPAPVTHEETPKLEYPSTPIVSIPRDSSAVNRVTGAVQGERWDPNKAVDKLKRGVITTVKEQSKRSPTASHTVPGSTLTSESPVKINTDDGTNP